MLATDQKPRPYEFFRPQENCERVEMAARLRLLHCGEYFPILARCFEQARRSIFVIDWELDARLRLDPDCSGVAGLPLVAFLRGLLDARPCLHVHLLLWDRAPLFGGNGKSAKYLRRASTEEPRLHFHFRRAVPGAAHHAKLVTIDDRVAFIGGIDIAGDRRDREDHPPLDPRRVTPDGVSYGPTHDRQCMLDGPAAERLAAMAWRQWRDETGGIMPQRRPPAASIWPEALDPHLREVPIAIAQGGWISDAEGAEVRRLTLDAIEAAASSIYIETQYFASTEIAEALAVHLLRERGPEIVVVTGAASETRVERYVMDGNRDRLLSWLVAIDTHGRFRAYHPRAVDGAKEAPVKVRSKLVVVDDRFLRIGSSDLNNRSMALDTECDIATELADQRDRDALRQLTGAVIGQWLRRPGSLVAEMALREGSLIGAIEALDSAARLRPFRPQPNLPRRPVPGTFILDPARPLTDRAY